MEWISVKDRLPDQKVHLLFSNGKRIWMGAFHTHMGRHCWEAIVSSREEYPYSCALMGDMVPTHWMPLPSPPVENSRFEVSEKASEDGWVYKPKEPVVEQEYGTSQNIRVIEGGGFHVCILAVDKPRCSCTAEMKGPPCPVHFPET